MKKLWSGLLSAVLAGTLLVTSAGAAAATGYRMWELESAFITGSESYMTRADVTDKEGVAAIRTLLENTGKKVKLPADATETARITVSDVVVKAESSAAVDEAAGTSTDVAPFIVYSSGDNYYITGGSQCRTVEKADFLAAMAKCGNEMYKYRQIPGLNVKSAIGNVEMSPGKNDYRYRKVDGKFYRPGPAAAERVRYVSPDGKLILPSAPPSGEVTGVKVTRGDETVFEGTPDKASGYHLKEDGNDYRVAVTVVYSSDYYRGTVVYGYDLTRETGIRFSVEGNSTYPGEVVILRAKGVPTGEEIAVTTDIQFTPKFFTDGTAGGRIALLPVSYVTAVGSHWIEMSCGGVSERFGITANDKKFDVQHLTVAASTAQETILSQKANAEYEKFIAPLRMVADSTRRWNGRFILPVSDRNVTSTFGMIRYTNGSTTPSRHGALDLAMPRGTDVAASGGGRVLYAGLLQLTGNTVLIEHGYGLKTWYYHMDSLGVKTDDLVAQGDIIGTVGSTGFSTGPHLHFGMSVNNVFINPYTAIKTDLLGAE